MNVNKKLATSLAGYAASVVLANLFITWFGLWQIVGLAFPAGTVFAGAAFILRDAVHRYGGWPHAAVAVVVGAGLSAWLASPAIALASGTAFLVSELADAGVFVKVKKKYGTALAVALSGVVGAAIDTGIFLPLAGIPLAPETAAGQVAVKSVLSALAGVAIWRLAKRRAARA
jgi:uncharacterized PurR-regulated membrane protein YhhQ (DUF165 family)